ncbi:MAG TPA: ThuA domain-containing protein [Gemmataceae bacterium]|nr:ThuA domain-containing protein [Gemmataceae bacterium]
MSTLLTRAAGALAVLAAAVIGTSRTESAPAADDTKPIRALLVIGGCCHDYAKQKDIITKGVSARANVQWAIAYDSDKGTKHLNPVYESADWAKGFDVVVHDECCSDVKNTETIEKILKPHKAGLPAVVLHCGMHSYRSEGYPKTTPWFDLTGLATTRHGPQAPIAVSYIDKESPITKGLSDWKTGNEELYNNEVGKLLETAQPLARGKQTYTPKGKKEQTDEAIVAWTNTYNGKTKVFATTLGHNNDTVADAKYLDLVTRGLLWSVGKLDESYLKPAKKVLIDEK